VRHVASVIPAKSPLAARGLESRIEIKGQTDCLRANK
jgi:hypothetical protein